MPDKYRGSKEYLLVYSELIRAARYRGAITYQEKAKLMGVPTKGSYMASATGQILGEIVVDEHAQKWPMLSAIAVNLQGVASPGFYTLARELGRLQDGSKEGERQFWEKEKAAVYETWRAQVYALATTGLRRVVAVVLLPQLRVFRGLGFQLPAEQSRPNFNGDAGRQASEEGAL